MQRLRTNIHAHMLFSLPVADQLVIFGVVEINSMPNQTKRMEWNEA